MHCIKILTRAQFNFQRALTLEMRRRVFEAHPGHNLDYRGLDPDPATLDQPSDGISTKYSSARSLAENRKKLGASRISSEIVSASNKMR